MKRVVKREPESGWQVELRSDLEDWEKEFPNQIRVVDLPGTLYDRWLQLQAQTELLEEEIRQAWGAADQPDLSGPES